jgi:membrane-bound lytic murein transglycosylase D
LVTTRLSKKRSVQYAKLNAKTHTVRRGDTLQSIAQQHGTTVQALLKYNSKHSVKLKVGERIDVIAALSGAKSAS